jgi:drug/metabolite transporter (DMT)-like permease
MHPQPASARDKSLGLVALAAVLLIWTSFIVIARGSAAHKLAPLDIVWLRFIFSGLVVLPYVGLRWPELLAALGGTPRVALARAMTLTATAGVGYCGLAYSGFFLAPAAHAAVLLPGSLPLWTVLFSLLLLGEKFTVARGVGLALIVAGDLWVGASSLWGPGRDAHTWRGDLLFLSASMTWALYGVLCRRWQVGAVPATVSVAAGSLLAVPPYALALASGAVATGLPQAGAGEMLFQAVFQGGISMLLAGIAYTRVVHTFGPMRTTMATAIVPALAALAAVPLLDEPLNAATLGGLACVTIGLLVGTGVLRRPSLLRAA